MADRFELVDLTWPYILRGTQVGTADTGAAGKMWNHFEQPQDRRAVDATGGGAAAAAFTEGLSLGYCLLQNRAAATIYVGIGVRIPNRYWIAGQWTNAAATPYTDDTTDAQSAAASDFAMETTTANDGYVVASQVPFNAIGINVGTASIGAGVVRAWRHSNRDGTGWVDSTVDETIVSTAVGAAAGTNYATGENVVVIAPMTDWGRTQVGGLNGVPGGRFALNIRATTAPTTAGQATAIELYRIYLIRENVADNAVVEFASWLRAPLFMPYGDMLVPFFSTSNLGNRVTALVRSGW